MSSPTNSKVTLFFGCEGGTVPAGWTETYYNANTTLDTVLTTVRQKYVPKRAALLGQGAKVIAVRVTNYPPDRISRIAYLTGKEGDPSLFTTSPNDDFDPVQVCLLCRYVSINGHRRQGWVDGLPDSVTDQLIKTGVIGSFTASPAWKQFVASFNASGLQIRFKTANGPPILYGFEEIVDVQPIMVRKRNRGRPFSLFRGRRLA